MSEKIFVIEKAGTAKDGKSNYIKGYLTGDFDEFLPDNNTSFTVVQKTNGKNLESKVFKKDGEDKRVELTGDETTEFFGSINYDNIVPAPSYDYASSSLHPDTAKGILDTIRLLSTKPTEKTTNTFVITLASTADYKNVTYAGHFEGGVDNAHYVIFQDAVTDAKNSSTTVTISKGDDKIVSARLSENNPMLSGFFASMGAIDVSDNYDKKKIPASLPSYSAIGYLTSLKNVTAAIRS